jgi:hypothetical protein
MAEELGVLVRLVGLAHLDHMHQQLVLHQQLQVARLHHSSIHLLLL